MPEYLPRLADPVLDRLLAEHPAVLLVGPRACGKTTTGRRHCVGQIRLDRPAEARVARVDPDAAINGGPFPLLIDEWQVVPEILGAVKRAVDDDPAAGRFVIAGSTQADLTAAGWPATGRLIRLSMYGFTEGELAGQPQADFLDRLITCDAAQFPALPDAAPNVRDYITRALRGTFPEAAIAKSADFRRRWLASYIDQLVSRDASLVGSVRDPMRLRRYLQALAACTAETRTTKRLADAAGISQRTADGLRRAPRAAHGDRQAPRMVLEQAESAQPATETAPRRSGIRRSATRDRPAGGDARRRPARRAHREFCRRATAVTMRPARRRAQALPSPGRERSARSRRDHRVR